MATRNGSSAAKKPVKPTAEAREALAMWGLALRYASAAVTPVAKGATQGVKNGVKERLSAAASSETSLKERLNPSTTDRGGKVGDAADALLAKMGKPGKLASKVSLGSRVVGRLAPGTNEEAREPELAGESGEPVEEPEEAAADSEEEVEEPEASRSENDDPEAAAKNEPSGSDADDEDQAEEAEDDEPDETPAESNATDGHLKPVRPHSEPVRVHPGADPLHTDFDHAYSDEVENYEHRDAYATTR